MDPKANAWRVRHVTTTTRVPPGIEVHYAFFTLYCVPIDSNIGQHWRLADLSVPCRSNLYKFLIGLLYNWNWNPIEDIDVTEEQAKYLRIIFKNQKDYDFWKEGLEFTKKEGNEKAWEWVKERIPLLKLRNELGGGEKHE